MNSSQPHAAASDLLSKNLSCAHLPATAVAYPADCKSLAIAVELVGFKAEPVEFPVTPVLNGYCPVISVARVGAHSGIE
jgi:hypothetical protein